jgi:DeoR family transcriptional regulator, suf operon transcriptional repressor
MPHATISAAGIRVVKLLVGKPPQTVNDLIERTHVTRTAVTEQLNELLAAGFVERGTQKLPGRGRPRHVYSATETAQLLLFADKQMRVVPAIWKALDGIGGKSLTQRVIRRVSRDLAKHYNEQITARSPRERLKQFAKLLAQEGLLIETHERNGQVVLRKRSCAFLSMYEEGRSICCLDAELMSEVVGCRVRQTASRHDGAPCCTFEIAGEKKRKA